MTKDEALKLALDFISRLKFADAEPEPDRVMDAISKALLQPEQKPDIIKSFYAHANHHFQGMHISARKDENHNLKLIFDGETGILKSAEVL